MSRHRPKWCRNIHALMAELDVGEAMDKHIVRCLFNPDNYQEFDKDVEMQDMESMHDQLPATTKQLGGVKHRFKCGRGCDATFPTREEMEAHDDPGLFSRYDAELSASEWKCQYCDEIFPTRKLRKVMKIHACSSDMMRSLICRSTSVLTATRCSQLNNNGSPIRKSASIQSLQNPQTLIWMERSRMSRRKW
jgi:hypothetical protein